MTLSLHVAVSPDRWSATASCDVVLRRVLRNDGTSPISIVPAMAKLDAVASFAGVGIHWSVAIMDEAGSAVPLHELRRWYGPPGNPPPPSYVKDQTITLEPRREHVEEVRCGWIPHALLEPRHLTPTALDPEGMDAIAQRIPLANASVLVLSAGATQLAKARAQDDFLRGHVVAFFAAPGAYQMKLAYVQQSWMNIGERWSAASAPVALHIES